MICSKELMWKERSRELWTPLQNVTLSNGGPETTPTPSNNVPMLSLVVEPANYPALVVSSMPGAGPRLHAHQGTLCARRGFTYQRGLSGRERGGPFSSLTLSNLVLFLASSASPQ